jgi:hypothetical protein
MQKTPELYNSLAKSFIDYCDIDNNITHSKVRFCLRFKFRIPLEKLMTIIKEFESYNILIRKDKQTYSLNKKFIQLRAEE